MLSDMREKIESFRHFALSRQESYEKLISKLLEGLN